MSTLFYNSTDSDCVNNIFVNPITRTATVEFRDESIYEYTGVPFKALLRWAVMSPADSVGEWVNEYLVGNCDYQLIGYED